MLAGRQTRILRRSTLVAAVLAAAALCISCAPADVAEKPQTGPGYSAETSETTDAWGLWTADSALRGANTWQRRVFPELDGTEFLGSGAVGPPYEQADYDYLASLGANYVNVSHPGLFTERAPFVADPAVVAHLDDQLQMIGEAGMWAVISFRTGPGRTEFTFNRDEIGDWFGPDDLDESVWTDADKQDAWVEMWRYTADRYRDHPAVIGYDLMVEPNANETVADEWDPEAFYAEYRGTLADWNQLHPRIARAIREIDQDTPILVEGMSYGSVEWLDYLVLPDAPRVVVAVHQYAPNQYTHQQDPSGDTYPSTMDVDWDGQPDQFDREWLAGLLASVEAYQAENGVPVVVNEFGLARWQPGAARYLDDEMTLFEEAGWSHAYWQWMPDWDPLAQIDQYDYLHGTDIDNHENVPDNELIGVLREHWADLARP